MNDAAGFTVSPQALASAKAASASVGDRVTTSAGAALPGSSQRAVSAHPGWQASGALQACLTTWQQALQKLTDNIQWITKALEVNGGNYQAEDDLEARAIATMMNLGEAGLAAGTRAAVTGQQG